MSRYRTLLPTPRPTPRRIALRPPTPPTPPPSIPRNTTARQPVANRAIDAPLGFPQHRPNLGTAMLLRMLGLHFVGPRTPPRYDRRRRYRASVMLGLMAVVVAQLSWGCHLPTAATAVNRATAATATPPDEAAIRALIASAYCDSAGVVDPLGKTGQSSLCLHCTTGSENLRVAREGAPWDLERLAINSWPPRGPPIVGVGHTPPARGPPKNASSTPLFESRSV